MVNNIFILGISDKQTIDSITEICGAFAMNTVGVEGTISYKTVPEVTPAKMQLRLNALKGSTILIILSDEVYNQAVNDEKLAKFISLENVIVFSDIESLESMLNKKSETAEEEPAEEEIIEEIEEPVETVEEVSEEDEEEEETMFSIPEDENNSEDSLMAENRTLRAELEELRNQYYGVDIDELNSEISDLKLRNNELESIINSNNKDIEKLNQKTSSVEDDYYKLLEEKDSLEKQLADKTQEFDVLVERSSQSTEEFENLRNECNDLKEKLENQQDTCIPSTEVEELSEELYKVKQDCDEAKSILASKEHQILALEASNEKIKKDAFYRIGRKSTPKAVIGDTLEEISEDYNFTIVCSGSGESLNETASYIKKMVESTQRNTIVVDLCYETFLDYALDVKNDGRELISYIKGDTDRAVDCSMSTRYQNVRYIKLCKNFVNDSYYFNVDWTNLFKNLRESGVEIIIHLGTVSGVFKGTVLNTLSQVGKVYVVIKPTTINIRTAIMTLSALKLHRNPICVCPKPRTGNLPSAYNVLSKKYTTNILSDTDGNSF